MSRYLAVKNLCTIWKRWMDLPPMPLITICWFSSVLRAQFLGDLRLAYLSDLLFGCKDSEKFSITRIQQSFLEIFKQKGRERCDKIHIVSLNPISAAKYFWRFSVMFIVRACDVEVANPSTCFSNVTMPFSPSLGNQCIPIEDVWFM